MRGLVCSRDWIRAAVVMPTSCQASGPATTRAGRSPGIGDNGPVSIEDLTFDAAGLIPAVVQQYDTREVLMVGWMDAEAVRRTATSGRTTFWSRSRQAYWVKGETSGNRQHVKQVLVDCDADTLLVLVDQEGPACHTGTRSCFSRPLPAEVAS